MKPICLAAACALPVFLMATPGRALDFTLSSKTVLEDGYPHGVYSFAYDAQTSVTISAPPKWRMFGTPATLVLTSGDFPGAEIRLEKSPFAPGMPFKDQDLERYRKRALAQAPPGSTEVLITADTENPLPIYGWTDHEFLIEYAFYGQRFKRSVMFLNLDAKQQLQVTAIGLPAAFDRIHKAAYLLLRNWQDSSGAETPNP